jgi:hypothetical protein
MMMSLLNRAATRFAVLLIGGSGAVAGASAGVFVAEVAVRLGLASNDKEVADSEIDLWLPFAACSAVIGIVVGLMLGWRFILNSSWRGI